MPKGLCGFAFWDHGQKNKEGVDLYKVKSDFYITDITYKLKEFKYFLKACEMQKEAHYTCPNNKALDKINFYEIPEFKHFLLKNKFWGLHLKAYDIDITEYTNKNFYDFSIKETLEGIRFGFNNFCDSLVLHPGTFNGNIGKSWPNSDEVRYIQKMRKEKFLESLEYLLDTYTNEIFLLTKYIEGFYKKQFQNINTLKHYFQIINIPDISEDEYYRIGNEIMKIIRIAQLPVKIVRYAQNPMRGLHLCLENIEPPNFLINTPKQHRYWYDTICDIYEQKIKKYTYDSNIIKRFYPKMLVDVNHYLHSKKILTEENNRKYSFLFPDFNDLYRDFVRLAPEYKNSEPLLNKIIRENDKDIFYYHIGGCYIYEDVMYTHEPVKAIRNQMYMIINSEGVPVPKYATGQFNPSYELNMEEVIQVIGCEHTYILEVFNRSSELIKSSQIYTSEYINFLFKEKNRLLKKVLLKTDQLLKETLFNGNNPEKLNKIHDFREKISNAKFFIIPYRKIEDKWKVGYEYAGFYLSHEKPKILAKIFDESGKIQLFI